MPVVGVVRCVRPLIQMEQGNVRRMKNVPTMRISAHRKTLLFAMKVKAWVVRNFVYKAACGEQKSTRQMATMHRFAGKNMLGPESQGGVGIAQSGFRVGP